jgi:hypothetical protein
MLPAISTSSSSELLPKRHHKLTSHWEPPEKALSFERVIEVVLFNPVHTISHTHLSQAIAGIS